MLTYRAGIVGCGRVGCGFDDQPWPQVRTHAGAYARTPGVDLVALSDVDPHKLEKYGTKYGVSSRYEDFERMLANEQLDLLSICTKSDQHAEVITAAVKHGVRGILCEKPFTTSLEEADRAIGRCDAAGVALLVNHSRRFDEAQHRIAKWLNGGGLGRVQYASAQYGAGLLNTGTHLVDVLRLYFGDVGWVQAVPSPNPSGDANDVNLDAWIGFASGIHVAIQAGDARAFVSCDVSVTGTDGRAHIKTAGFDIDVACERAIESTRLPGYRELQRVPCLIDLTRSAELAIRAIENLMACVDGTRTPLCSGRDGRAALAVALTARASAAENGRHIPVPASMESLHVR